MIKNLFTLIVLVNVLIFISCDEATNVVNDIVNVGPRKYVAVGDSLTTGVQSNGLVIGFQQHSFPFFIAQQLGVVDFEQPLIGRPGIGANPGKTPLMFRNGEIVEDDLQIGDIFDLALNPLLPRPYDNLGIPGDRLFDIDNNANIDDLRFLILRGMGSQLDQAIELDPEIISFWIGANDVLGAALHGGDLNRITPKDQFDAGYRDSLTKLRNNTSALIVAANIPDVVDIPFINFFDRIFRTIPALGINTPVPVLYDQNFQPIDFGDGLFIPILTNESDVVHLLLSSGRPYEKDGIGIPNLNALIELGFPMDQATQLITQIQNHGLAPSGLPFNGEFTLTSSEQEFIQNAVEEFNSSISNIAFELNVPMVDANGLLSRINNEGVDGFTGEFVLVDNVNTAFSLDGVHPNNAGYAIIANEFIKVMNDSLGMNIALIETDQLRGQYAN
jgi:lysophospholipase L1-like esterase